MVSIEEAASCMYMASLRKKSIDRRYKDTRTVDKDQKSKKPSPPVRSKIDNKGPPEKWITLNRNLNSQREVNSLFLIRLLKR